MTATVNPTGYAEALQDAWSRTTQGGQEADDILQAPRSLVERVQVLTADPQLATDAEQLLRVIDGTQRLVRQAGDAVDPATGELVPATDEQFDAELARLMASLRGEYPGVWPDDWLQVMRGRSISAAAAELWNRLEPGVAAAEVERYGIGTVTGLSLIATNVPLNIDPLDWLASALEAVTRAIGQLVWTLALWGAGALVGLVALRYLTRPRQRS